MSSQDNPHDDLPSRQLRHFAAVLRQAADAAARLDEHDARAGAEALARQLVQLIELQTLEANRQDGKAGGDAEVQARYVKAALADEVLLHTDWPGRVHWQHVLLEATLFDTASAGQQVFADIDALLQARDPARRGVARLYLHLLSLGFQGRYRGGASLEPVAAARRELFQFIYQRPADLGGSDAVVAQQPYTATLSYGTDLRLPKASRRAVLLAAALLLLLGASEILWLWQSWPVREAVDAPLAAAFAVEVRSC